MLTKQSNTQTGLVSFPAVTDLTGKEGRLLTLGAAGVNLPSNIADRVPYLLEEGAASGDNATVRPLQPGSNIRIRAKGTGNRGSVLVLAAIAGDDAGKVRALPGTAGTYHAVAIAEESFVDGQLVLCRPISREAIVV